MTVVNDDILGYGNSKQEFDERLHMILRRFQDMDVTLNPEKYKFARNQVPFLNHITHDDGINFMHIQKRLHPSQKWQ